MAKKLLEAQVDDGEDGQTNGVLQHYAYRYEELERLAMPTQEDTSHTHAHACLHTHYPLTEPSPLPSAS